MNNKNTNRRFNGNRPKKRSVRNKKVKTIDPSNFIKKAIFTEQKEYEAPFTFQEMELDEQLKKAIQNKGFISPTEIQAKSVEALIDGRDIIGIANTGTGKTGAFLIPIIHRLLQEEHQFQTLIVLPTRELALQVEEEFQSLTKGLKFTASTFIGGTNVGRDLQKLRKHNDVIIGTPGRLIDMMNQGALKLQKFEVLVLDEFDRMLDMGFVRDVERIIGAMRNRQQTMLFSATIEKGQDQLINTIVSNPVRVSVSSGATSSESVDQSVINVEGRDKYELFKELISGEGFKKVLVFAETKRSVDKLSTKLTRSGFASDTIHGNKTQNYRVKALNKFKNGKTKILVATDVAARGIDISDITHVINYQQPSTIDSYIHRIGRTGRAGKKGYAFTFVD